MFIDSDDWVGSEPGYYKLQIKSSPSPAREPTVMFILGKTSCALQALAIAGISLNIVRPSAARSWQTTLAYVNDENDKATDWEGEVQAYEPGKLLAIRKGSQQEVKLDLTKADTTYFIAPGVVEGREVIISDKKLANGRHEVTVRLKDKHG